MTKLFCDRCKTEITGRSCRYLLPVPKPNCTILVWDDRLIEFCYPCFEQLCYTLEQYMKKN